MCESMHVSQSSLKRPIVDRDIWNFARLSNLIIVTFDEDFKDLANVYGFPPKVILLRTGNSSTKFISELIINKLAEITQFNESDVYGLLEIF